MWLNLAYGFRKFVRTGTFTRTCPVLPRSCSPCSCCSSSPQSADAQGRLEAGVATVDTTYHVGSSAGQYASTRDGGVGDYDPHVQQGKNQASYGIQSRLTARAIVVREAGGQKHAILKTDLYIPQDMLWRRVAHCSSSAGRASAART